MHADQMKQAMDLDNVKARLAMFFLENHISGSVDKIHDSITINISKADNAKYGRQILDIIANKHE